MKLWLCMAVLDFVLALTGSLRPGGLASREIASNLVSMLACSVMAYSRLLRGNTGWW